MSSDPKSSSNGASKASSNGAPSQPQLVNLTIDGKALSVPKGTNLIKAAASIGIEVPYYCYHPHLSVPGNCRMCQLHVKGQPKLMIGCHTQAQDGMEVSTHLTNNEVRDAQAATLELILINHPLDCTVCDQAGHCKLQDYHYQYNARPSRFVEEKVHKVKAQPLGPTVMLDGERCIMCTRCIRFCDEITKTSELGMLNRGDRSVITVNPGKVLDNPLSGTVVDLCPVGALTHKEWRFNTRIWFTKQSESICPGCSTGCNVKVAVRDDQVVHVKARMNDAVNKEWLCDEGRYGFGRFVPEQRVLTPQTQGVEVAWEKALADTAKLKDGVAVVFVSPDLLVEDYWLLKQFCERILKQPKIVLAYRERKLSDVEAILISPDYAANYRGAEYMGLVSGSLQESYNEALRDLQARKFQNILLVGDRAILPVDQNPEIKAALAAANLSVAIACDQNSSLVSASKLVLPGRSILEKSGFLINRAQRLQYAERLIDSPQGSQPEWRIINRISEKLGAKLVQAQSDRDVSRAFLASEPRLAGLRIAQVKAGGICLKGYAPQQQTSQGVQEWR